MIDDDAELSVVQRQLTLVESTVEGWRKKLMPDHPQNFALYAEGAIEEAAKLRAEIDEYLARRETQPPMVGAPQIGPGQQPTGRT